jgi:hypothetical protein
LAFAEPNLKLSDAQPFFCVKIPNRNLDKRDFKCKICELLERPRGMDSKMGMGKK